MRRGAHRLEATENRHARARIPVIIKSSKHELIKQDMLGRVAKKTKQKRTNKQHT